MINLLFDNNVLQLLCKHEEFDRLLRSIADQHEKGLLSIHRNPLNVFEQLQGVTANSLPHVKYLFERAKKVWLFGQLVLSPKWHLLDCVLHSIDDAVCLEDGNAAVELVETVISCQSIKEFESVLGGNQKYLKDTNATLFQGAVDIVDSMRVGDPRVPTAGGDKAQSHDFVLGLLLAESLLRKLGVLDKVKDEAPVQLLDRCKSLRYFANGYAGYCLRFARDLKRRPKGGDSADLLQVVYLDVCDYLVSQDGDLAEICNTSPDSELRGRVIPFSAFTQHLDLPHLVGRAHNPGRIF